MMLRRALLCLFAAIAAGGGLSPPARADGDPGSDVLVFQNLFVGSEAGVSVTQQAQLGELLTDAAVPAFRIRVAIIAHRLLDLGAVTALWQKPQSYARFLGLELSLSESSGSSCPPDGFRALQLARPRERSGIPGARQDPDRHGGPAC